MQNIFHFATSIVATVAFFIYKVVALRLRERLVRSLCIFLPIAVLILLNTRTSDLQDLQGQIFTYVVHLIFICLYRCATAAINTLRNSPMLKINKATLMVVFMGKHEPEPFDGVWSSLLL